LPRRYFVALTLYDEFFAQYALCFAVTLLATLAPTQRNNFAQMTAYKARRHPESIKNERIGAG
jgi:hypothetical protein